ncbi:hypothetical protein LTS08_000310 [Lithohypha guttulata]|uniref:Uncharacterized protein n=1 Tax=Lithohypha guttulata TaxID=1690604 RepID=A0AAN7YF56_9EURO|nr:hypothetical protein LTR05_005331 [Lithohypha guttulata]KAK5106193.1 hypothetical protein LTS08_000310 [Lithohypha guttulata]
MDANDTSTFKAIFDKAYHLTESLPYLYYTVLDATSYCRLVKTVLSSTLWYVDIPVVPDTKTQACGTWLRKLRETTKRNHKETDYLRSQQAVKWYQIMYNEVRDDPKDGPHHRRLLEQALDALCDAEERVTEAEDAEEEERMRQNEDEVEDEEPHSEEHHDEEGVMEESQEEQDDIDSEMGFLKS